MISKFRIVQQFTEIENTTWVQTVQGGWGLERAEQFLTDKTIIGADRGFQQESSPPGHHVLKTKKRSNKKCAKTKRRPNKKPQFVSIGHGQ